LAIVMIARHQVNGIGERRKQLAEALVLLALPEST
jgi:hypothetical protein